MSMPLLGVYGASGFGREVMPLVRSAAARARMDADRIVFVDDAGSGKLNGHRVLTFEQFVAADASERSVVIAIADPRIRARLADRCGENGVGSFQVRAENVVVMDDVSIGEGGILSPFVTITSNVRIGRHFHANLYSYVAHDCRIGNFVTFAPAVKCNGNVVVEDYAYIGTGAVIRQGVPGAPMVIGAGAVVGMGAVVTKSVLPGTTVVGNPARPIVK